MFHESIDEQYIVNQTGTSEGTQIKYYKDGYWYKKDNRGKEGLTEYLISQMLLHSDLNPDEYVLYEQGTINGKAGCRSANFLKPGDELITLYRLYYNQFGKDLSNVIGQMNTMEERIRYVLQFVKESCELDLTEYFSKIFTLDMLVLNEDRHLNNIAVIFDGKKFIPAPIFDQGVALLTANQSVNWKFGIEENVKRVIARPFSGSHQKMYEFFGTGFRLDTEKVLRWIQKEDDSVEKKILEYQIHRYKNLISL
ncbi:MAG: hypothetical protein MJ134_10130 [Lachnospiraceae bacterium]|nr:hypothetical protein [Lachnospiraceae bacterium]